MLQASLVDLPAAQRQALDLAFGEDLTHEQVATELNLPLGTAKTRIRTGLQNLRSKLSPQLAAVAFMGLLIFFGLRYHAERTALQRDERALALVTASDTENLRLAPALGVPPETHARYRGHPGMAMAVLTFSNFPPAPIGKTYQLWVRHQGAWTSLGTIQPDASGAARLLAEDPVLAVLPEVIQVTLEPTRGSITPSGSVVVVWLKK
jgi:RNA polymerase sigma-70 factor (ECF subfamily)